MSASNLARFLYSLFFSFSLLLLPIAGAWADDSASLTQQPVQASGGGVPVGTVITWPISSMPEDAENWLECDGRSTAGTDLAKLMANTPDYRGYFLRGVGGKSAAIGEEQADAGRNIRGGFSGDDSQTTTNVEFWNDSFHSYTGTMPYGAFKVGPSISNFDLMSSGDYNTGVLHSDGAHLIEIDASGSWGEGHTTDSATGEFRPVNKAVKYIIRCNG